MYQSWFEPVHSSILTSIYTIHYTKDLSYTHYSDWYILGLLPIWTSILTFYYTINHVVHQGRSSVVWKLQPELFYTTINQADIYVICISMIFIWYYYFNETTVCWFELSTGASSMYQFSWKSNGTSVLEPHFVFPDLVSTSVFPDFGGRTILF